MKKTLTSAVMPSETTAARSVLQLTWRTMYADVLRISTADSIIPSRKRQPTELTRIEYECGAKVVRLYKDLWVAIDVFDKQVKIVTCPTEDGEKAPWLIAEDLPVAPPDVELSMKKFVFANGWSAEWMREEDALREYSKDNCEENR